jgi:hypothetical protein
MASTKGKKLVSNLFYCKGEEERKDGKERGLKIGRINKKQ